MKSVLISIRPKWCELIASCKKTIEVRKTRPKIEAPFKVYIYCTHARNPIRDSGRILMYEDDLALTNRWGQGKLVENPCGTMMEGEFFLNGKVIGEFVCDCITGAMANNGIQTYYNGQKGTCLSDAEIIRYAGGKKIYYWHISDLKIYDNPMELSRFYKCGATDFESMDDELCEYCARTDYGKVKSYVSPTGYHTCEGRFCDKAYRQYLDDNFSIARPPQSWCYVEELQ